MYEFLQIEDPQEYAERILQREKQKLIEKYQQENHGETWKEWLNVYKAKKKASKNV